MKSQQPPGSAPVRVDAFADVAETTPTTLTAALSRRAQNRSAIARVARTGTLATLFCALAMGTCAWANAASIATAASADPAAGRRLRRHRQRHRRTPGSYVYAAWHTGAAPCPANAGRNRRLTALATDSSGTARRSAAAFRNPRPGHPASVALTRSAPTSIRTPTTTPYRQRSASRRSRCAGRARPCVRARTNLSPSDPLSVAVSGQAEGSRYLFVAAVLATRPCGATALLTAPDSMSGGGRVLWPNYGDANGIVGPGLFATLIWTPPRPDVDNLRASSPMHRTTQSRTPPHPCR